MTLPEKCLKCGKPVRYAFDVKTGKLTADCECGMSMIVTLQRNEKMDHETMHLLKIIDGLESRIRKLEDTMLSVADGFDHIGISLKSALKLIIQLDTEIDKIKKGTQCEK